VHPIDQRQPSGPGQEDAAGLPCLVLDTIPEAYVRLDAELRFRFINRAAEPLLGLPRGDLIGRTPWEIHPESAGTDLEEGLRRAKAQNAVVSFENYFKPWSRWYAITAMPDAGGGLVARFSDVTERKKTDDRYRHIFNEGSTGVFQTSPEGRLQMANPALARMLRYASSEELLAAVSDSARQVWVTPDQRSRFVQAMEEQGVVRGLECRYKCKDGDEILVSLTGRRVAGPDGKTAYYEGFIEDITARERQLAALREAEEAIRDRERQLLTIYSSVVDAIFLLSVGPWPEFRFLTVNDALLRMTGLTAEQVVGKTVQQVIPEPSLTLVLGKYRQAIEGSKEVRWEETTTYPAGTKSGEVVITPIVDETGCCTQLVGLVHELTEAKRSAAEKEQLQEQLRQAQKLESIGRLAGGVAHDFNNLLTIINGYAGLLAEQLRAQAPLLGYVTEIQKAGDNAASLTGQLLAFSRKQVIRPRPLDLNSVVRDAERMLQRLMGEDIEFRTTLDPQPAWVMADPAQIHQVMINIAANSRDAMPDGGRFELITSNVEIASPNDHSPAPGRFVLITLRDTGMGMTEEVRQNIFEPFYTTKQLGKGAGLGLATVYGIIRQSGGWIDVQSQVGQGAAFHIYLPRIDAGPLAADTGSTSSVELCGGETVLVVEDDDAVRSLTTTILRGQGYNVLEAGNGQEACLVAKSHTGRIHLLLTDVVMPGMNGKELSKTLRGLCPGLKVLLMSGYAENVIARRGVLDSEVAFIQKPFTSNSLAAKVRQLLA
jgi:two-component system, cell cycle sensor histidine kinase and response regulator CckA